MAASRSMLAGLDSKLEESVGLRVVDYRPVQAPVPRRKDILRRPATEFGRVAVDQVIPDPEQPRTEFDPQELDRLAQSIRDKGQLSPIRVRWSEEHEKWMIIAGERRWRATRLAGLATVECYFHEGELSKTEVLEQQLIENLLRDDLKPLEEATAFDTLIELNGWTAKQLAEALRLDPSRITRSLALLRLPGEIRQQVDTGVISATAGYELAKLKGGKEQRQLADRLAAGKLTRDEASKLVQQQAKKNSPQRRRLHCSFVAENGVKLSVTVPPKGTYDDVLAALHQSIEEVEHYINSGMRLF